MSKKGLIDRLNEGPVIGDGGMLFCLEKRGYVKAGLWTPEVVIEHPDAVRQLHKEFARCGADVLQSFTFYADKSKSSAQNVALHDSTKLNKAASAISHEVAGDTRLVAGSISGSLKYFDGTISLEEVSEIYRRQCDDFVDQEVDFIILEYFENIKNMELAINEAKGTSLPVCATMCMGLDGDTSGVGLIECAERMVNVGADVVGLNCMFGLIENAKAMKAIKEAFDKSGITTYLMSQPMGYHSCDAGVYGIIGNQEFPFALEPRQVTRIDVHKWARELYNLGVQYIGGCCGFEPYHIRAIAEELSKERGVLPEASAKSGLRDDAMITSRKSWCRKRTSLDYWYDFEPASGRPFSASSSKQCETRTFDRDRPL